MKYVKSLVTNNALCQSTVTNNVLYTIIVINSKLSKMTVILYYLTVTSNELCKITVINIVLYKIKVTLLSCCCSLTHYIYIGGDWCCSTARACPVCLHLV